MVVHQVAQLLLPALLAVVERPGEFEAGVRRRALGIAHSMAAMLATVRGTGGGAGKRTAASVEPLLDAWFPSFLAILRQPTTAHVGLLSMPLAMSFSPEQLAAKRARHLSAGSSRPCMECRVSGCVPDSAQPLCLYLCLWPKQGFTCPTRVSQPPAEQKRHLAPVPARSDFDLAGPCVRF